MAPPVDTRELARRIRLDAVRMVARAGAAHIGSALSITDLVAVLYAGALQVWPDAPRHRDRDRFLLSKGHACVAVYAALAQRGFFDPALLETYGAEGSDLMAHISHHVPGVEFSTGSLGHGLPFGTGKALAARMAGQAWRTVVLMSDGEMAEGSNWEAILFAAHHRLDRLTAIIDFNNLQSLTTVAATLGIEPLADKFRAFGWHAVEIDGHDHTAIAAALDPARGSPGKPTAIIARTVKGKGVSFMENQVEWHYRTPKAELLDQALAELEGAAGA